jgi:hypothetical protein
MVTTANPLAIYQVAERLRECIHGRLETVPPGAPERSCVTAGQIAWDDCECGQLIVSIGRTYFSSNFPTEGNAPPANPGHSRCGPPIQVTQYTVSILRCAPSGGDDPAPPTCVELDAAAKVAAIDAWAVRWGAHCCLREWAKSNDPDVSITDFLFQGQNFVGPNGACMGSELTILVGLINSCPPCDAAPLGFGLEPFGLTAFGSTS